MREDFPWSVLRAGIFLIICEKLPIIYELSAINWRLTAIDCQHLHSIGNDRQSIGGNGKIIGNNRRNSAGTYQIIESRR
jgi:hypothetical protein